MSPDDYPIEKGVPMPPTPVEERLSVWQQVTAKMEIDDSFLLKEGDDYREPLSTMEKAGMRGEVRQSGKAFRVWRVK